MTGFVYADTKDGTNAAAATSAEKSRMAKNFEQEGAQRSSDC
jgi:hypothetical protein